jgi:hypothetical protein
MGQGHIEDQNGRNPGKQQAFVDSLLFIIAVTIIIMKLLGGSWSWAKARNHTLDGLRIHVRIGNESHRGRRQGQQRDTDLSCCGCWDKAWLDYLVFILRAVQEQLGSQDSLLETLHRFSVSS